MGLRASFLTVLLLLIWVNSAEAARHNHCLDCHPAHYVAQGRCNYCHQGNQQTDRKELAHSNLIKGEYASFTNPQSKNIVAGKKLADQTACRRCHTLAAHGNRLASNLDSLLWTTKPEMIRKALVEPATYMPNFYFSKQDLDITVTIILAGGLQAGKVLKEPPQVVHFSDAEPQRQNVFAKQCGGCHKLLSKQHGGLGTGASGPNLSGLMTRFYPPTFGENKRWNEDRLKRWLKNPRDVKAHALMRPITIKSDEFNQLLKTISQEYY